MFSATHNKHTTLLLIILLASIPHNTSQTENKTPKRLLCIIQHCHIHHTRNCNHNTGKTCKNTSQRRVFPRIRYIQKPNRSPSSDKLNAPGWFFNLFLLHVQCAFDHRSVSL